MAKPCSPEPEADSSGGDMLRGVSLAAAIGCGVLLLALAGCRNIDNAQVDILESQLRQQEDYIYELEDYLLDYSEKLRQARMVSSLPATTSSSAVPKSTVPKSTRPRPMAGEPQLMDDSPKRPASSGARRATPPVTRNAATPGPVEEPAVEAAPEAAAPAEDPSANPAETAPVEEPSAEPINPKELEAPDLEIGPGVGALPWRHATPLAAAPSLPPDATAAEPLVIPDPVDYQADAEAVAVAVEPPPTRIERAAKTDVAENEPVLSPANADVANDARLSPEKLEIRRVFGEPSEKDPATLGRLMVVVEALNNTNEPTGAEGEASLMVLARDESGTLKWIDRWDFTTEETAAAWQSSHLGDGLHLELPLDRRALPTGELQLWARLVDADGRRLLASAPFEADQLTSLDDADETKLASTDQPAEPIPAAQQAVADAAPEARDSAPTEDVAATKQAPKWKAASKPLDANRVESFASTAAGKPHGWASQPASAATPRVAQGPATDGAKPSWQQGATTTGDGGRSTVR